MTSEYVVECDILLFDAFSDVCSSREKKNRLMFDRVENNYGEGASLLIINGYWESITLKQTYLIPEIVYQ